METSISSTSLTTGSNSHVCSLEPPTAATHTPLDRHGISPWAVAHGCHVVGFSSSSTTSSSTTNSTSNDWTWKVTLTSPVHTLLSYGSILLVAVQSDGVSLLQTDGKLLQTTRLPFSTHEASVSFVYEASRQQQQTPQHAMLVLELNTSTNNNNTLSNQISLVSGFSKKLQTQRVRLPAGWRDVMAWNSSPQHLRLVAIQEHNGALVAGDYQIHNNNNPSAAAVANLHQAEWTAPNSTDMGTHSTTAWTCHKRHWHTLQGQTYLLCVATAQSDTAASSLQATTRLVWMDPMTLRPVCHYSLSRKAQVLAIEASDEDPVVVLAIKTPTPSSHLSNKTTTTSTATTNNSTKTRLLAIQVVVEETMGLSILCNPHVLYTIPLEPSPLQVAITTLSNTSTNNNNKSLLWKAWKTMDECQYRVFQPNPQVLDFVATFRHALARSDYTAAAQLSQHVRSNEKTDGETNLLSLALNDPYCQFHPTELDLKLLQAWWGQTTNTSSSTTGSPPPTASQHLLNIAAGVRAGYPRARAILLQAIQAVTDTPSPRSILEQTMALKSLVMCLEHVRNDSTNQETANNHHTEDLMRHIPLLQARLDALEQLQTIGAQLPTPSAGTHIRSTAQLYAWLWESQQYTAAERLGHLRVLTLDELVEPLWDLSSSSSSSQHRLEDYMPLLRDLILVQLGPDEEILARLRTWACRMADQLDEERPDDGLDTAVNLLKMMDKETKEVRVKMHSSFAFYSPFVERLETGRKRFSPRNASVLSETMRSSATGNSSGSFSKDRPLGDKPALLINARTRPAPTLLEFSALRGGATKSRTRRMAHDDDIMDEEDCVESKLRAALCLQKARQIGMHRTVMTLREFDRQGGAPMSAKALVHLLSTEAKDDHDKRWSSLNSLVKPFCNDFAVDYDDALLASTNHLCKSQVISKQVIIEAASISRCCISVIAKGQAALSVIRGALRCGDSPDWLAHLSKQAIQWASCDSSLQSELEEATRLLLIDRIVLRYCGAGAKELFRVDNPRHAIRLLNFVCKHVDHPSIVEDTLALCEAFHHLSAREAGSAILCNALVHKDDDCAISLLKQLFEKSTPLAQSSLLHAVAYAEELLEERRYEASRARSLYPNLAETVIEMLSCAMDYELTVDAHIAELSCFLQNGSLKDLRSDFLRVMRLEREHGIFASLSALSSPIFLLKESRRLFANFLCCKAQANPVSIGTGVTSFKKACALLEGTASETPLWVMATSYVISGLVLKLEADEALNLLETIGLLDSAGKATHGVIVLAMSFCQAASRNLDDDPIGGIGRIGIASSLFRDWALMSSSRNLTAALVSVASNLDLICSVLTRSDEGVGERLLRSIQHLQKKAWQTKTGRLSASSGAPSTVTVCPPKLHPSWYVGDGLLLPPEIALERSLVFSRSILFALQSEDNDTAQLFEFISDRGAHFLALRLLSSWSSTYTTRSGAEMASLDVKVLLDGIEGARLLLAERSLGGSGTGITNAVVDSELAVSLLLSLTVKTAFKTYKACLPTAVKTRNFDRLLSLANVGIVSSSGDNLFKYGAISLVAWKGQEKFLTQCIKLASRARWSKLLQRYQVPFDSQRFGENEPSGSRKSERFASIYCPYAASLVPAIISALSRSLPPHDVISLTKLFAEEFGLDRDMVIQKHVVYILSESLSDSETSPESLCLTESIARSMLRLLKSVSNQCLVLRRCLIALESAAPPGFDYERFALVLSLYQESLRCVVNSKHGEATGGSESILLEYELVNRRRDALTILLSFFQGEKRSYRPSFCKFFPPLNEVPSKEEEGKLALCGVLGKGKTTSFDPLEALETSLRSFPETATAAALAPLCFPLGLPSGYIHARSLIVRFSDASSSSSAYPSFENDVVPACERLRSPADKAALSEWCASQYQLNDKEKLNCLDLALKSAVLASTGIERRRQHNPKCQQLEELEEEYLQTVRRMSAAKEALSDRLRVKTILATARNSNQGGVDQVAAILIQLLDEQRTDLSPEELLNFLFNEGSRVAAASSLMNRTGFSISQLRQFSAVVHEACTAVSEQHSHIHPQNVAKRYARKWLLHGDEANSAVATETLRSQSNVSESNAHDTQNCDDTNDFVMDLADIHSHDYWGAEAEDEGVVTSNGHLTCQEEPRAAKPCSRREMSEIASHRVALRIAFVLYYHNPSNDMVPSDKENSKTTSSSFGCPSQRKRTGLLAKIDTKRDTRHEDRVLGISRELLNIVFARAGSSSALMKVSGTFAMDEIDTAGNSTAPRTITFAMRHRALRAASILCPQAALEQVSKSEGHITEGSSGLFSTLRQCTFGSFVAKEIEEMGLPLPHDDLVRLSSMNFLSYARTLWRHYRGNDNKIYKGRLMLLLVEMSLRQSDTDTEFVSSLVDELIRLRLPRTILHALEAVHIFVRSGGTCSLIRESQILLSLENFQSCLIAEASELAVEPRKIAMEMDFVSTVERLYRVFAGLTSVCTDASDYLKRFIDLVAELARIVDKQTFVSSTLDEIALRAERLQRCQHLQT